MGIAAREGRTAQRMIRDGRPSEALLREVTERIVRSVAPRRVGLFGAAARGEMGPNSDLDILVVMPDGVHRRTTAHAIYRSLAGVGFATDVVVVTEADVREHGTKPWLVLAPALSEGREVYRARP